MKKVKDVFSFCPTTIVNYGVKVILYFPAF